MSRLFSGTPLDRPVTCERCELPLAQCKCPRTAAGRILLPKDQSPRVRREKRNAKFVTIIAHLDPTAADLPALLKSLRTTLATGGSITADNELLLQGDHRDRLVEHLKKLGYAAKASGG